MFFVFIFLLLCTLVVLQLLKLRKLQKRVLSLEGRFPEEDRCDSCVELGKCPAAHTGVSKPCYHYSKFVTHPSGSDPAQLH